MILIDYLINQINLNIKIKINSIFIKVYHFKNNKIICLIKKIYYLVVK